MKIAVSAHEPNLEGEVDSVFGRCSYFVVVDLENNEYEAHENENAQDPAYTGIRVARFLSRMGVQAVITGVIGPQALEILAGTGIQVFTGVTGQVRKALEAFDSGKLQPAPGPIGVRGSNGSNGRNGGASRRKGGKRWW